MIRLALATLLLIVGLGGPSAAQTRADPEAASGRAAKPLVEATTHMIVAAHPAAAKAGREMLRAGGSAADAAIAALLVLNVVEPQSSGIGGGAFALVLGPEGLTSFDARETAPLSATPRLFFDGDRKLGWLEAVPSGRSVGVPGQLKLMEDLHRRHGRLPWPRLFYPAIQLAEGGFPVSPRLAASIAGFAPALIGTDAAALFLPEGTPLAEGEILRNPALARSFRRIALLGAEMLYQRSLGDAVIASVQKAPMPGALTAEDLAAYRVIERAPVCHGFQTWRVCGMGPPSSGATTVGQILGLIEATGGAADDPHLFAEASRLAYADRGLYLADPDQVKVPVTGLLDPAYLAQRAALIDPERAAEGPASPGTPPWQEGRLAPGDAVTSPGTTHLSVIDGAGLAISLTASIETAFGSKRVADGFLLNNQLTDFSFTPAAEDGAPVANAPGPGKRPRSSMAPTMVFEGDRLVALAGSPGGSRIPEYVATSLLAMLASGMDPAEAAARPHISQRNRASLVLEAGRHSAETRAALAANGHQIEESAMTSGLHLIRIAEDGVLQGGADPRREGIALGD
ncbi:MAG: gamma-glutamyltransferase [Pseudomonadota bacterium]